MKNAIVNSYITAVIVGVTIVAVGTVGPVMLVKNVKKKERRVGKMIERLFVWSAFVKGKRQEVKVIGKSVVATKRKAQTRLRRTDVNFVRTESI